MAATTETHESTRTTPTALQRVVAYVSQAQLEERRRLGLDTFDEMWEGVLHMVPPPGRGHQTIVGDLRSLLLKLLRPSNPAAVVIHEFAIADPDRWPQSFRTPDVLVDLDGKECREAYTTGADLAIEVRSPGDETYEKLHFFAARGVKEVLVIDHRAHSAELYLLRGAQYVESQPDGDGWLYSRALDLEFRWQDGRYWIRRRGATEPAGSVAAD